MIRNKDRTILVDTGFDRAEAKARGGRALSHEPRELLKEIGIDGTIRAEALSLEQHLELSTAFG